MTRGLKNSDNIIGPEPSTGQITEQAILHIINETVVWCNDAVTDFFDLPPEDIIGKACHDVVCYHDEPCELCSSATVEPNGGPLITRVMNDTGDLDIIYCFPLDSRSDWTNEMMLIISRCGLDRVVSHTTMATTPRYRSLVEIVPDLVGIIDDTATLLFTQRVSESPSYRNLIGKSVLDMFTPTDVAGFMELVQQVFSTGEHVSRDILAVGANGNNYLFDVSIWPITDGASIEQAYIVARDVSGEDEALSALLEIEERFRFIFNDAGIGIVLTDVNGRILDLNPSFSQMLGYSKEEMVSKPFIDLLDGSDPPEDDDIFMDLAGGGMGKFQMVRRLRMKDGGIIWVNMELALHPNLPLGTDSVFIIVDDITQLIELEHSVKNHLEYEQMLIDFSKDLLVVSTDDVDGRISNALKKVSGFLDADGAFICLTTEDTQHVSITNSWMRGNEHSDIDETKGEGVGGAREPVEGEIKRLIGDVGSKESPPTNSCDRVMTHYAEGLGPFEIVEILSMKNTMWHLIAHSADIERSWSNEDRDILQYAARNLALVLHRVNLSEARESFFNHTSDLLGIYNRVEGAFTRINPAIESFVCIPHNDDGSVQLMDLVHTNDIKRLEHHLNKSPDVVEPRNVQLRFISLDGEIKWAELQFRPSLDGSEVYVVGRDITEQKRASLEAARRQMDYEVEEGHVYLELSKGPETMLKILSTLVDIGYYGVIFCRSPQLHIPGVDEDRLCQYWFADNRDKNAIRPDIGSIRDVCSRLPPRSTILVDRLDYLLLKKDFNHLMEIVHFMNDLAYLHQHIILLSIDPQTFTDHQIRIIEKECSKIEKLSSENLSTELMDIIKIAHIKSLSKLDFGYIEIMSELGISKPTARKRISSLIQQEYLQEMGSGRRKQFSVTEKGRKRIEY